MISLGSVGIYATVVASRAYGVTANPDETDRDRDQDKDEAPETPPDEPSPPRVEDPPSEPGDKGPYVVRDCVHGARMWEDR